MISQPLLTELHEIILQDYGKNLDMRETSDFAYAMLGYFEGLLEVDKNKI